MTLPNIVPIALKGLKLVKVSIGEVYPMTARTRMKIQHWKKRKCACVSFLQIDRSHGKNTSVKLLSATNR